MKVMNTDVEILLREEEEGVLVVPTEGAEVVVRGPRWGAEEGGRDQRKFYFQVFYENAAIIVF